MPSMTPRPPERSGTATYDGANDTENIRAGIVQHLRKCKEVTVCMSRIQEAVKAEGKPVPTDEDIIS